MITSRKTSFTGKLFFALLVSNLVLVRKLVLSNPICTPGSLQCQVLLSDLFDRAIRISHYIHLLSTEIFEDFHNDLLSLVNQLLRSWNQPLQHLTTGAPDHMIKKLKEAEEHTQVLQGGIDRISGRMLTDLDDFYPPWFGPIDAAVPQRESQMFSIYHLLHCFRRDSHKIDNYLKILRCRMIHANNC
ncbi:prolactin-like isoform X2 [Lithobates pipiens]